MVVHYEIKIGHFSTILDNNFNLMLCYVLQELKNL